MTKNTITVTSIYEFSLTQEIELKADESPEDIVDIVINSATSNCGARIRFKDGHCRLFGFDNSDLNVADLAPVLENSPQRLEWRVRKR